MQKKFKLVNGKVLALITATTMLTSCSNNIKDNNNTNTTTNTSPTTTQATTSSSVIEDDIYKEALIILNNNKNIPNHYKVMFETFITQYELNDLDIEDFKVYTSRLEGLTIIEDKIQEDLSLDRVFYHTGENALYIRKIINEENTDLNTLLSVYGEEFFKEMFKMTEEIKDNEINTFISNINNERLTVRTELTVNDSIRRLKSRAIFKNDKLYIKDGDPFIMFVETICEIIHFDYIKDTVTDFYTKLEDNGFYKDEILGMAASIYVNGKDAAIYYFNNIKDYVLNFNKDEFIDNANKALDKSKEVANDVLDKVKTYLP